MSRDNLLVFFKKVEQDENFRIKIISETGIKKEIIFDSLDKQKKIIKEKIVFFAQENGFKFGFDDFLDEFSSPEYFKKLESDELDSVAGGISIKGIVSLAMASGMLSAIPVSALNLNQVSGVGTDPASTVSAKLQEEDVKNIKFQTLEKIIKENPNLNKVDQTHPLNEIDNLIFSTISYMPFLSNIPKLGEQKDYITIAEYADTVQKIIKSENNDFLNKFASDSDRHTAEDYKRRKSPRYKKSSDPLYQAYNNRLNLLEVLAKCERYKDIKIGDCSAKFKQYENSDNYYQFAAISFLLENGERAVAFRGTDTTLSGWKEDVDMLLKNEIQAQTYASGYLRNMLKRYPNSKFTVSGHSKGGNLAVYSFLKNLNNPKCMSQIKNVHSFDGPGIRDDILKKEEYKTIYEKFGDELKAKVTVFSPQETIVSTFMSNNNYFSYFDISSNSSHLYQHDSATWLVNPNFTKPDSLKFKFSEKALMAISFEKAWSEIVKNIDKKALEGVSDVLFDFCQNNELRLNEGITSNLKKLFFNYYVEGKSVKETLKLIVLPGKAVNLSDKEYSDFKNIIESIFRRDVFKAAWSGVKEYTQRTKIGAFFDRIFKSK